ncbi:hypothetical protein BC831DRAFT_470131 [Entophlyctis helioformis]|nr:hypothetical protein BC831DRAFT_470131 [Entophlyctis helioformis]
MFAAPRAAAASAAAAAATEGATASLSSSYDQVRQHYTALLSEHYTWTFGGSKAKHSANLALLGDVLRQQSSVAVCSRPSVHASHSSSGSSDADADADAFGTDSPATLSRRTPSIAVDLGCGSGFQTIPLLHLGFDVVAAVDACGELMQELKDEAAAAAVAYQSAACKHTPALDDGSAGSPFTARLRPLFGDMLAFRSLLASVDEARALSSDPRLATSVANVIVCMGDTLTHLASLGEVRALLADSYAALRPGGRLVLQFRDLTRPLHGVDRFIPVRSDERTVFTCFLEWDESTLPQTSASGVAMDAAAPSAEAPPTVDRQDDAGTDIAGSTDASNVVGPALDRRGLPTPSKVLTPAASPAASPAPAVLASAVGSNGTAPDGSGCRVRVHDLVHVKKGIGAWELCKSWYWKLGLSGPYVAGVLESLGFEVVHSESDGGGMVLLVGEKGLLHHQ